MGSLCSLCQKKPPLVLMLGSECEIKRKVLQRNFESFIGEIKGKQEFEELNIFVEGPLQFKLLDIGPDQLEDKYERSIRSADVIIFMTTPGYEQFDIGWIESFKDSNQYSTKPILFFIHKDSELSFTEDALPPLWKVIVTKYDNEEQTDKAFQWVNAAIKAAQNKIKIPFSLPLIKLK